MNYNFNDPLKYFKSIWRIYPLKNFKTLLVISLNTCLILLSLSTESKCQETIDNNHIIEINQPEKRSLTIYQNHKTLVNEFCPVKLNDGINTLRFLNISRSIIPQTIMLISKDSNKNVSIIEKSFHPGLENAKDLLADQFKQKNLTVNYLGNNESKFSGKIIDNNLLVDNNELIILEPNGRYYFTIKDFQDNSLLIQNNFQPFLNCKLKTSKLDNYNLNLSYLMDAINSNFEHLIILNNSDSEKLLSFNTQAIIQNTGDLELNNVSLNLVVGNLNFGNLYSSRAKTISAYQGSSQFALAAAPAPGGGGANQSNIDATDLDNYYIYNLPNTFNFTKTETKSINLINKDNITYKDYCVYQDNINEYSTNYMAEDPPYNNADNYIEFANNTKNNLNIVIPKGLVQVYKKNHDNQLEFLGSDSVNNVSQNQDVKLKTGQSYDVKVKRKIVGKTFSKNSIDNLTVVEIQYKIQNFSKLKHDLNFYIASYDKDLIIQSADQKYTSTGFNKYLFNFSLKPNETTLLNLKVKLANRKSIY